ncbi:hypothetical protein yberc0001_27920 [Yersinia bercovieri ATCC 43970]|uniref:Uncharacterized protein n=1 Tax=Yersinia bercovieri ATCC 43970 TaxID=349968 RepID=A0ABP2E1H8_YERBE|nr:hypothetical protein yberc0001_27920 [Yersinia bercovieri ATCC 43970]
MVFAAGFIKGITGGVVEHGVTPVGEGGTQSTGIVLTSATQGYLFNVLIQMMAIYQH